MLEPSLERDEWVPAWVHVIQPLAKLAFAGASLAMGATLLFINTAEFVAHNTLISQNRNVLFGWMLAGAALPVLAAIGVLWRRPAVARARVTAAASIALPVTVLGFVPALLLPDLWYTKPLPFLLVLVALGLFLEYALRAPCERWGPPIADALARDGAQRAPWLRSIAPALVVLLGCIGYAAYTYYFSVQQHHRMYTSAFDLGIYDNLMFNAMKGHPFRSPVLLGPAGGSYLVGHAEFAMLLFVPFYALHPGPEFMLGLQAVLLGFAAWPLYLFARHQLTPWSAVVLALCYLLFGPLHGSSFYDFHWLPLSVFFQFWLYYAIATRRTWLVAICWTILVLIREDVSVGLVFLGLFLIVTGLRVRLGLFLASASAVAFVTIKFGVMLWAGPFHFANMIYGSLIATGETGWGSIIKTLVINPIYVLQSVLTENKVVYFLHMFGPLLFLPLRRLALALLVGGGVFFTLLTTDYPPTISIHFQYTTHWIPYLFAAAALMLGVMNRRFGPGRRWAALGAMAFVVVIHSYVFGALLQRNTFIGGFYPVTFRMTEAEQSHYKQLREMVAKIPPKASVAATEREVPHVSTRFSAYTLRVHHGDADFILIDRDALGEPERSMVNLAFQSAPYGLVSSAGRLYLFRRGFSSPETAAAAAALGLILNANGAGK
jgi:uncharacterized membrane protein